MHKEYSPLTREEVKLLVAQAQKGDKNAMAKLYEAFLPFQITLAQHYRGPGISYEDLLQQIGAIFIESVQTYDDSFSDNPTTHIISRTRWHTLRYYQNEYKTNDRFIPNDTDNIINLIDDREAEDSIYKGDVDTLFDRVRISVFLDVLTEDEREIFDLYFVDDLSQEQISEVLDVPRSYVVRKLKAIREKFFEENKTE